MTSKSQAPDQAIRDKRMRSELYKFLWARAGSGGKRQEQPHPELGDDHIRDELQRILGASYNGPLDQAVTIAFTLGMASIILAVIVRIVIWVLGIPM